MIDRIVVVNDRSHPRGGASLLALASAGEFAKRGYPTTVLAGDEGNPALAEQGIQLVTLGQKSLLAGNPLKTALNGLYNRTAAVMLGDWVHANDTPRTVYHLHGWSQIFSPAVFTALAPVAGRVIMTSHDFFLTCPNGAMFDYRASAPCRRRPLSADCVTTNCDRRNYASKLWRSARGAIQERCLERMQLPPQLLIHQKMGDYFALAGLTADDMVVLPNPARPYCDERVAVEQNRHVLYVGRMEETKGVDLAAAACRAAGAHLVAVGEGALLPQLKLDYPEMTWAGRIPSTDIGNLARFARMLVMPSRHMEPFGLVAVEALWSGLPVLASRDSLLADDIEACGAGLSIDVRDPGAFSQAIRTILTDDGLARSMSDAAYHRTGHLALTAERWIDAMLSAYETLLTEGRSGLPAAARRWLDPQHVPASMVVTDPARMSAGLKRNSIQCASM